MIQYITFYVSDIMYGVPILAVREIGEPHNITQVQGSDQRIDGLMNLRGQIIVVVNLGTCLDLKPVAREGDCAIVILKTGRELSPEACRKGIRGAADSMALLVNRIGDVIGIDETDLEPAPAHIAHEYVSGVIKLKDRLLTLLSTEWIGSIGLEEPERRRE